MFVWLLELIEVVGKLVREKVFWVFELKDW